jgi:hypothetical protein
MQRSLAGLYRTLLHGALKACTELIQQALPALWKQSMETPWQVREGESIPEKDIRTAFSRLIRNKALYSGHCFCFFIDGLDEYEEKGQHDQRDLVDLLCQWVEDAPLDVKLCVSSREYNVYMNSFSAKQRLRLHELTRYDMEGFVRNRLNRIRDEIAMNKVVDAILSKAQGIFLWVTLTVRVLRYQLENGFAPGSLLDFIRLLPELPKVSSDVQLDDLYEFILFKQMTRDEQKMAFQTFAMLDACKGLGTGLTLDLTLRLLAYSFFQRLGTDPEFAMRDSFDQMPRVPLKNAWERLNGWSRGLVECSKSPEYPPGVEFDGTEDLDYAHRSIPEFLQRQDIQSKSANFLEGFDAVNAVSQLILAELRIIGASRHGSEVAALVHMRYAAKITIDLEPPFTFLECLGALDQDWESKLLESPETIGNVWLYIGDGTGILIASRVQSKEKGAIDIFSPLIVTLRWPQHPYPLWKLSYHATCINTSDQAAIFLYSIIINGIAENALPHHGIVDVLLGEKFLLAQKRSRLFYGRIGSFCIDPVPDLTIWQHFLINVSWRWQRKYSEGSHTDPDTALRFEFFADVAERFLQLAGIDPHFTARFEVLMPEKSPNYPWRGEFVIGLERTILIARHGEYESVVDEDVEEDPAVNEGGEEDLAANEDRKEALAVDKDRDEALAVDGDQEEEQWQTLEWSLRGWIEAIDLQPEKKKRILGLLDKLFKECGGMMPSLVEEKKEEEQLEEALTDKVHSHADDLVQRVTLYGRIRPAHFISIFVSKYLFQPLRGYLDSKGVLTGAVQVRYSSSSSQLCTNDSLLPPANFLLASSGLYITACYK